MTFKQWMKDVDFECAEKSGLSIDDLADQPFRDWFDSGAEPEEAAKLALAAEGFEGFEG